MAKKGALYIINEERRNVMKANYHTHTPRCNHARGTEEQYIKAAIEAGHRVIGFSDHSPWHYNSKFVPTMRMKLSELDHYLETLKALREKYKDKIEVKIGLECEYYPQYMDWLKETLKEKEIDYIILGNHFKDSDEHGPYYGTKTADDRILKRYVDDAIAAMKTGLYSYVAHPDVIHYYDAQSPIYKLEMERLCAAAKEMNIPLEFNLLGYSTQRHYPNESFWEIAARNNNTAILGIDAHDLFQYKDEKWEAKATQYLNDLGIKLTDEITYLR